MRIKKQVSLMVCGLALGLGLCSALQAQQFSKPEDAIKYRKSALTLMGAHFSQIAAMAQGKTSYDAKVAQENAALVQTLAKLPWAAFVEGSDKGETKAKAEIWSDSAKFREAQERLIGETEKLVVAAKTGKLEDLKVATGATGGACKNCHDNFRAK
jgi:cytochrome c556